MTIYGNDEELPKPVFVVDEISQAAGASGEACIVTGEIQSINYSEAAQADETYVTADVLLDDGGLVTAVDIHYHCETYHGKYDLIPEGEAIRIGFEAFKEGDRVILLKSGEKRTIIGFEDGLPHPCYVGKVLRVANAFIDLAGSGLINGPLPDERITEATEDNPGVVQSPQYILYGTYSSESIQLFVIGGTPPFKWKVENIEPCSGDSVEQFMIQPISYMIDGYSRSIETLPKTPFSGLAGGVPTETTATSTGSFIYRTAVLAVDENVLGLAKITVTDYFGHETYLYVRVPCCFQDEITGEIDTPSFDSDSIPAAINCNEYFYPTYSNKGSDPTYFYGSSGMSRRYPISLHVESGSGGIWPNALNQLSVQGPDCDDDSNWESPIVICGKCRNGRTGTVEFDCAKIALNYCPGGVTIIATDTQMNCGEMQTLSTSDGSSFYWRIKGEGKGSLSHSKGAATTYIAPNCGDGCNPSCLYSPTIELVCMPGTPRETILDEITISVNCYSASIDAYREYTCRFNGSITYEYGSYYYWYLYKGQGYLCDGSIGSYHYARNCRVRCIVPCTDPPTNYFNCREYGPGGSAYSRHCIASTIWNNEFTDMRTAAMIEEGCCPEALM